MAAFSSIITRLSSFFFIVLVLLFLIPSPSSSFSFTAFLNNNSFNSDITLLGDANVVIAGDPAVKLTKPSVSSSGFLIYKKPFTFLRTPHDSAKPLSFSTHFSFSITQDNGDGLAFLILPESFISSISGEGSFGVPPKSKFLALEFDARRDSNVGDLNGNHVGVDVNSLVSSAVVNVSSINLVLSSGKILEAWIDYDSSSKRIEVRLAEARNPRPYNPLLAYSVDLWEMWKDEEIFVGISSSSSGKSLQSTSVYSWTFEVREVPSWMHSQPLDPLAYSKNLHGESTNEVGVVKSKRNNCPLSILAGLIFATGCGSLVAFILLFLWVVLVGKNRMIPELPVTESDFKYEKISVVDRKGVNHVQE